MRKLSFLLILVVLVFGCKSTPKETEKDAAYYYNQGDEYYNMYLFDQAISEYTEALNKDPEMADAHLARGNAYSGKLEQGNALDDYKAAARLHGDYDFYARGYSMLLYQDYKAAIDEFSLAIEHETNLAAAYNDRGLAYANMGNQDKAIEDYEKALSINSKSAFAYNNRGNAYLSKRDYNRAIDDYTKAAELYPQLGFAYSGRGFANFQLKEYDNAISDYTQAIAIAPDDSSLYTLRRNAYLAKGEKELAEADRAMAERLRK